MCVIKPTTTKKPTSQWLCTCISFSSKFEADFCNFKGCKGKRELGEPEKCDELFSFRKIYCVVI